MRDFVFVSRVHQSTFAADIILNTLDITGFISSTINLSVSYSLENNPTTAI